jgi:hypothetical protein
VHRVEQDNVTLERVADVLEPLQPEPGRRLSHGEGQAGVDGQVAAPGHLCGGRLNAPQVLIQGGPAVL